MIFGYVLLNDWSARDIQAWEYQPLGPFQAKATATTISPWIVTAAALEPFRISTPERERALLPYLREPKPMLYDIDLDVALAPEGGTETDHRAHELPRNVLLRRPATGASHHKRLPDAHRRSAWLGHHLGPRPRTAAARCWNSAGAARSP